MKLFLVFSIFFYTICSGQISFEKGYIVNLKGEKIDCLIKNYDWLNNPEEINYKISNTSPVLVGNLNNVKEFKIQSYNSYINALVNIDMSSEDLDRISTNRQPEFVQKKLFLEQIVDGASNLYKFRKGNQVKFFFNLKNDEINQLVFKSYYVNGSTINQNVTYKQQILNGLSCENISKSEIVRLKYKEPSLVKLFNKYNNCVDPKVAFVQKKRRKSVYHFYPKVGVNSSQLLLERNTFSSNDFGNKVSPTFGVEGEVVFPFNKNKWSFFLELSYLNFKEEKNRRINSVSVRSSSVDYKSIEVPFGIRHYMFINKDAKVFLNLAYNYNINLNSSFSRSQSSNNLKLRPNFNFSYGAGFNYKKYRIEARFNNSRDLRRDFIAVSPFKGFSFFVAYELF